MDLAGEVTGTKMQTLTKYRPRAVVEPQHGMRAAVLNLDRLDVEGGQWTSVTSGVKVAPGDVLRFRAGATHAIVGRFLFPVADYKATFRVYDSRGRELSSAVRVLSSGFIFAGLPGAGASLEFTVPSTPGVYTVKVTVPGIVFPQKWSVTRTFEVVSNPLDVDTPPRVTPDRGGLLDNLGLPDIPIKKVVIGTIIVVGVVLIGSMVAKAALLGKAARRII